MAYTKPELRARLKAKIKAGSKGGKPGSWSGRKAQLLAQAYKRRGGGYKGERTEAQESLKRWGEQNWMTRQEYEKKDKS